MCLHLSRPACHSDRSGRLVSSFQSYGRCEKHQHTNDDNLFHALYIAQECARFTCSYAFVSTLTLTTLLSACWISSAVTSAGIRSGVELTNTNIGPKARAISPKVTQNPMSGLVLIWVFMPYEIAWPMASRQRNAAPLRTFAVPGQHESHIWLEIAYPVRQSQMRTAASTCTTETTDLSSARKSRAGTSAGKARHPNRSCLDYGC